ncbi:MAG: hypothetical protein HOE40_02400, partial [Candidatus Pacebacteria bacterium]|nr:hypothetical protein [Candidatus Paceibacterota bacterium]
ENPIFSPENRKFITPQEELEFLREKVAKQEQVGRATSTSFERAPNDEAISQQIHEYKKEKPSNPLGQT